MFHLEPDPTELSRVVAPCLNFLCVGRIDACLMWMENLVPMRVVVWRRVVVWGRVRCGMRYAVWLLLGVGGVGVLRNVGLRDATLHSVAVRGLNAQVWCAVCVLSCLSLWWVAGFLHRRGDGSVVWCEVEWSFSCALRCSFSSTSAPAVFIADEKSDVQKNPKRRLYSDVCSTGQRALRYGWGNVNPRGCMMSDWKLHLCPL